MAVDARFMAAVLSAFDAEGGGTPLLPAVLSRACVEVLPVAGAGISLTGELRIPLGASDEMMVRAERLQTTLGEGPCLTASATSEAFRATGSVMAQSWPMFHRELLRQTPYRTVVTIPLRSEHHERFGALDLYSTGDDAFPGMQVEQVVAEVGDPISAILFDEPTPGYDHRHDPPAWLVADSVIDRMAVWVAIGMIMEVAVLTNGDALATLRAYAFSHDTTLDDVAAQFADRRVTPDMVTASSTMPFKNPPQDPPADDVPTIRQTR